MNKLIALMILTLSFNSFAFVSGSTGADGELNITETTQLQLPPSGIFNFTNVTIAQGAVLTFIKNANNTPVTILASGDITIDGVIRLNAGSAFNHTSTPNILDGTPGEGGPGGFNGGKGGFPSTVGNPRGEPGFGPGAGNNPTSAGNCVGAAASYGSTGGGSQGGPCGTVLAGPTYGNGRILPLIGGSGGTGGSGSTRIGAGGGGGGGAMLLAASGTITINGALRANGTPGGVRVSAGPGGSGSGGAIKLMATTIQGEGTITATGGTGNGSTLGGNGRIRFEAENLLRVTGTTPGFTFSTPGPVFVSNLPAIRISTIGGVSVPAAPTGFRDVELPGVTTNPVTIEFETTNVPLGTVLILSVIPERNSRQTFNTFPVSGSINSGTTSVDINIPNGNSTLFAQTTFPVTAALGQDFSRYAQGEMVEKVTVTMNDKGRSETTFITVSGREYTWPSNAAAIH